MATNTAPIPSAVVNPAISIIRFTRAAISAVCSGSGSVVTCSFMRNSLNQGSSDFLDEADQYGERRQITVEATEKSQRLDRVLATHVDDLSRTRLKALIVAGHVAVADAVTRDPAYHVKPGDTITIDVPPAVPPEPEGEDIPLNIVYEDNDILVL